VALVCSLMVSTAAIVLRPLQEQNRLIERSRNIVRLTGLLSSDERMDNERVLEVARSLDVRLVDLEDGEFSSDFDPDSFDERAAVSDAQLGVDIPPELDSARLGRRSRFKTVYLVWQDDALSRIILPIHGQGMWSTLYGFIALGADLDTIADITFYEQAETAGLGDRVADPQWHRLWQGKRLFDDAGGVRFRVAGGSAASGSAFEVDGLTGATVTSVAVSALIDYWFGPHGYGPMLDRLRLTPPTEPPMAALMPEGGRP
jgi:Na+-transporting NADH:ubiquinone oxidoreductase subunit C